MKMLSTFLIALLTFPLARASPFGSGVCFADQEDIQIVMDSPMKATDGQNQDFVISGPQSLKSGENIIQFTSPSSATFRGFLIYAEDQNGQRIGSWTPETSGLSQTKNSAVDPPKPCPTETGQLTHATATDKQTPYSMKFVLPNNTQGDLTFKSMIVGSQDKELKLLDPIKIAVGSNSATGSASGSNVSTASSINGQTNSNINSGSLVVSQNASNSNAATANTGSIQSNVNGTGLNLTSSNIGSQTSVFESGSNVENSNTAKSGEEYSSTAAESNSNSASGLNSVSGSNSVVGNTSGSTNAASSASGSSNNAATNAGSVQSTQAPSMTAASSGSIVPNIQGTVAKSASAASAVGAVALIVGLVAACNLSL